MQPKNETRENKQRYHAVNVNKHLMWLLFKVKPF